MSIALAYHQIGFWRRGMRYTSLWLSSIKIYQASATIVIELGIVMKTTERTMECHGRKGKTEIKISLKGAWASAKPTGKS